MNNANDNQTEKRPRKDVSGVNNPFYGHRHTEQSKNLMKSKAQERARQYQKWKDSQHHLTMAEFLSNNPTVEQYIKTLVRESIERFIWKEKNHKISIPNQWD